jgi:MoaA/NifB/PqqE/SkfB family radical SAM enzyme
MTVTPANHLDVASVMRQTHAAGARGFRAGQVVSVGRGQGLGFGLSESEVQAVVDQFASVRDLPMEAVGWDQCARGLDEELSATGLPVEFMTPGYLSWHIRSDGWVTPCQIEEERLGHILNEPLLAIGRTDRLMALRCQAKSCRCIRNLNPTTEVDLPFRLAPAAEGPEVRVEPDMPAL